MAKPAPLKKPVPLSASIVVRLALVVSLFTAAVVGIAAYLMYTAAQQKLDGELGDRLKDIAAVVATRIDPERLEYITPEEGENTNAYVSLKRDLTAVATVTGLARLLVLDANERAFADTRPTTRIGDEIPSLGRDRVEMLEAWTSGRAASTLFRDEQGNWWKRGYARVTPRDASTPDARVALVMVEGSPAYFDALNNLRRLLAAILLFSMLATGIGVGVAAARIAKPVRDLAEVARKIGAGDLAVPITTRGRSEVAMLANTMNDMRDNLAARDREMQMMLSGIAHEVRNPLGGIELFAGLLMDDVAGDPVKEGHVRRIQTELQSLSTVVNDFLDYSRHRQPALAACLVEPLAHEVRELCGTQLAADLTCAFDVDLAPTLCVTADREMLRRALLNVARNAQQALLRRTRDPHTQARLVIHAQTLGHRVAIHIDDNGDGVPLELRERIFEAFFTTREKGSGLGLALARANLRAMGGDVTVSDSPLGGARFTFTLAAADPATALSEPVFG